MNEEDIKLLENDDWVVVCESPFEIRHKDGGAFASGCAAQIVLDDLKREFNLDRLRAIKDSYYFKLIDDKKFIEEINKTLDNYYE